MLSIMCCLECVWGLESGKSIEKLQNGQHSAKNSRKMQKNSVYNCQKPNLRLPKLILNFKFPVKFQYFKLQFESFLENFEAFLGLCF